MLGLIDRFGVHGVLGRPLDFGEIRGMELAEAVRNVYKNMENSEGWASWQNANPDQAELYSEAMTAAIETGYNPNG